MSESSYDQPAGYGQPTGYDQPAAYDQTTGWSGWIVFAGIMMIVGGSLNLLYGVIAAVNDDWVVFTNRANVYLDLSEWGWVHIILGGVVVLSGIGLLSGNILARAVAVLVASLSLIANFFFIPVYPLWALTVIVIDVLVIWAVTAHGREMGRRKGGNATPNDVGRLEHPIARRYRRRNCGCSSMAEFQPSKLAMRVRSPSPALRRTDRTEAFPRSRKPLPHP